MKRIILVLVLVIALLPILALAEFPSLVKEQKVNFGSVLDFANGLFIDRLGNLFINGRRTLPIASSTGTSPAVSKYASDGSFMWTNVDTMKKAVSIANQIVALSDQGVIQAFEIGYGQSASYIKGLDAQGNQQWKRLMNGIAYLVVYGDTLVAVVQEPSVTTCCLIDADGNTIRQFSLGMKIGGYIAPCVHGDFLYVSGLNTGGGLIAKFSLSSGLLKWTKSVSGLVNNLCTTDDSGNIYLAGSKWDTLGTLAHYLAKFSADNKLVWETKWFSRNTIETNYENWTQALVVSTEKNMVVVGGAVQKGNTHTGDKSAFLKGFALSTGDSTWGTIWDYPLARFISQVDGLGFDTNNDLIVVGNAYSSSVGDPPSVIYIQKYHVDKVLGARERKDLVPTRFSLSQNYPNPFNPTTVISYKIQATSYTTLKVYDLLGREIAVLVDEVKPAGEYEARFDASNLPSGTYFYRLIAGNFAETKKMVLVK